MSATSSRFLARWSFATVVQLAATALTVVVVALVVDPVPASSVTVFVALSPLAVAPIVWRARQTAPEPLRPFAAPASVAYLLQTAAGAGWCVAFLADGSRPPQTPGWWTPLLYAALVLALVATWRAIRPLLRLRDVTLDLSMVLAAVTCIVVAAGHLRAETGAWSWGEADASLRSLIGLAVVVLIGSAALGRWRVLPVPVTLAGLSMALYVLSSLTNVTSGGNAGAVAGPIWFAAALCALLAAVAVIGRVERSPRAEDRAVPGIHPLALALWAFAAWTIAVSVAVYGAVIGDLTVLCAGAGGVAWIGLAGLLRSAEALRRSRGAYRELEDALVRVERAEQRSLALADDRRQTIERLSERNVELRAIMTLLGAVVDVVDERSGGSFRSAIEDVGDDLTSWVNPDDEPS